MEDGWWELGVSNAVAKIVNVIENSDQIILIKAKANSEEVSG